MTYHFFFERKKLILLLSLLALAGVVLFVAGLLIGMNLGPAGAAPSLDPKTRSVVPPKSDSLQAPPSEKSKSSSDSSNESEKGANGTGSGTSARVDGRSGAFPDRREVEDQSATSASAGSAERHRDRITEAARQSVSEAPIEPETRSARSESPPGEATGGTEIFELQLSQVRSAIEADREVERFRRLGFAPYVVAVRSADGDRRFTVRIGPFANRDTALETQQRLARIEGHQSVLRFRQAAFGPISESATSPS